MGTPGVPLDIPKEVIAEAIKKWGGRITRIAADLQCHFTAMNRLIQKHPDLVELVADCRHKRDAHLCEVAEDTLEDSMTDRKIEPANALKAAFYVLNSKGGPIGYKSPYNQDVSSKTKITPDQINEVNDLLNNDNS